MPATNGGDITLVGSSSLGIERSSAVLSTAPGAKKKKSSARTSFLEPVLAIGGTNIFADVAAGLASANIEKGATRLRRGQPRMIMEGYLEFITDQRWDGPAPPLHLTAAGGGRGRLPKPATLTSGAENVPISPASWVLGENGPLGPASMVRGSGTRACDRGIFLRERSTQAQDLVPLVPVLEHERVPADLSDQSAVQGSVLILQNGPRRRASKRACGNLFVSGKDHLWSRPHFRQTWIQSAFRVLL